MKNFCYAFLFVVFGISFGACNNGAEITDTQTAGYIQVSVDETYKPVMEQAIKVFQSNYPDAHIDVQYKPQAECFKDYLEDSTRVIFVSRKLTEEEQAYAEKQRIVSRTLPLARDGLAFVVAKNAKRNNFSKKQIIDILLGNSSIGDYQLVFDNEKSSTVRIITDSVIPGKKLSENVFAANGSEEVIDYVAKNPEAIGVVGVPWVADLRDTNTYEFMSKVQVCGILPDTGRQYIRPYQAYIGLKTYPFTRNLYFITKETWVGLGTGLVNYLSRDGQYLFKQSKLFPLQVSVLLRETVIKEE